VTLAILQVIRAAKVLIGKINKKTAAHHKVCARYKLDEITDALQATPTHKLMTFKLSMNDVIGKVLKAFLLYVK